ncbi:hypothetical protein ZHAS_00015472 [Anopheles sinensis]|uniref:Uncharacterized protein n=1 Tax=Anopheles sinensis TaxID=74873 RepID=A0A084WBC0_ANOSI|nr:hypothetical protein ZHAS_00015472 [Anopheles sinensis]
MATESINVARFNERSAIGVNTNGMVISRLSPLIARLEVCTTVQNDPLSIHKQSMTLIAVYLYHATQVSASSIHLGSDVVRNRSPDTLPVDDTDGL